MAGEHDSSVSVRQFCCIDGILDSVVHDAESDRVRLAFRRQGNQNRDILNAPKNMIDDLKAVVGHPLRLYGPAQWRHENGQWHLETMSVERAERLACITPSESLERFAQTGDTIADDVIERIQTERYRP